MASGDVIRIGGVDWRKYSPIDSGLLSDTTFPNANAFETVYSILGEGYISTAALRARSAPTSRKVAVRFIVDGVVLYEPSYDLNPNYNRSFAVSEISGLSVDNNGVYSNSYGMQLQGTYYSSRPIFFKESFEIQYNDEFDGASGGGYQTLIVLGGLYHG